MDERVRVLTLAGFATTNDELREAIETQGYSPATAEGILEMTTKLVTAAIINDGEILERVIDQHSLTRKEYQTIMSIPYMAVQITNKRAEISTWTEEDRIRAMAKLLLPDAVKRVAQIAVASGTDADEAIRATQVLMDIAGISKKKDEGGSGSGISMHISVAGGQMPPGSDGWVIDGEVVPTTVPTPTTLAGKTKEFDLATAKALPVPDRT